LYLSGLMKYLHSVTGLLLLFTVTCFTACRPNAAREQNVFRYNQIGGMETLDPAFAKNLAVMWGVHNIYNTLLEVDSALHITPSLAYSWEVSADGLQYTFHLRTDVYFQDNAAFPGGKGRKMKAADVVYSFNRLIDPATASAGAWVFNDRVRAKQPFEAPDDATFVLHLQEPFRPLPEILTMPYCSVVPREAVTKWGKDFRNHPCGTGPFRFKYWDEGSTLVLLRNPDYWEKDASGKSLPYLEAVQVSFHETRAMEFLLFNQHKVDFINGIDGSMKDLVLTKKGTLRPEFAGKINLAKKVYLNTEYLGFIVDTTNKLVRNSPLKLQKIRQAINYAIDRSKIVTYFRNGVGQPATHGFIPVGMPGTENSPVAGYDYNPEKALQLLKEAGFEQGRNLPAILLTASDADADICNFVASQLNDAGIKAEVQVMLKSSLRQQISQSNVAFFKAQWIADYPDAETYLAFFYSKFPAPPNYSRFSNSTFDRWYRESLQTNNDTLRFALYGKMDSLAMSMAPVVPLFYDELLHFTQKNISGLQSNALNMIDLRRVRKTE
jgi:oligopeptide transport system substrate-binding protein